MRDNGFVAVYRGIFDHPSFAPEPFTEREAWLWIIMAAAWEDKQVRVGRAIIGLHRGQLAFALRFLASKFQWTESRVRRFLRRRTNDAQIAVQTTRQATIITVCNYDKHQLGRRTDDTPSDAQNEAKTTQRERTNNKEVRQEVSKKETREDALSIEFHLLWQRYENKAGKKDAYRAFVRARKSTKYAIIEGGFDRYLREKPPDRPWLNLATFFNGERWNDQLAQVQHAKPKSAIIQAADDLYRKLASFDGPQREPNQLRSGEGENVVRLLPNRGS